VSGFSRALLLAQAAYYLVTGLWPIVSIQSFMLVTGPKTDDWLVRTVGLLAAVIGLAIGVAALGRRRSPELLVLAFGAALAFAGIDLVYTSKGRIAPVYLADAVVQLGIVALLGWSLRGAMRAPTG
jgi:hypothetical protein